MNLAQVQKGADVKATNKIRKTPLNCASQNGNNELAHLLIKEGSDVDTKDVFQKTPLHWAAQQGHCEIVQLVIDYGTDSNARDRNQWNPLFFALRNGRKATARMLIEYDRGIVDAVGNFKKAEMNDSKVQANGVQRLKEALDSAKDKVEWTPLEFPPGNSRDPVSREIREFWRFFPFSRE